MTSEIIGPLSSIHIVSKFSVYLFAVKVLH